MFREMIAQGVKVIFCPSYWCIGDAGAGIHYDNKSEVKLVNSTCISRAFENGIVLVFANAAGMLTIPKWNFSDTLVGRSQITVPFKGAIKKLNHNHEEMFIQEVAEDVYGIKKDLLN